MAAKYRPCRKAKTRLTHGEHRVDRINGIRYSKITVRSLSTTTVIKIKIKLNRTGEKPIPHVSHFGCHSPTRKVLAMINEARDDHESSFFLSTTCSFAKSMVHVIYRYPVAEFITGE